MDTNARFSTRPMALTTKTMRLPHPPLMKGLPYHMYMRQFKRATAYGSPENSCVDFFLITVLNVFLHKEGRITMT